MKEQYTITPTSFPFKSTLDFSQIINYWESKGAEKGTFVGEIARNILEKIKNTPELYQPIEDLEIIRQHKPLVDLIMSAVFPFALQEEELAVAMAPFQLDPVFATEKFNVLFNDGAEATHHCFSERIKKDELYIKKTLKAYSSILEQFYGVQIGFDQPLIISQPDIHTGLDRFYKTSLNQKFYEIKLNGTLPVLTEAMIQEIKNNIFDIEIWKKHLPPHLFEFCGVAIVHLVDVTEQEILSSLKFDLLEKDSLREITRFESIQQKVRILLGMPNVKLGLAAFQKNRKHFINFGKKICHSILLRNTEGLDCSCSADAVYEQFVKYKSPLIINDITTDTTLGEFGEIIYKETGLKNLLIAPLYHNEEFIGIVELGSPEPGTLSASTLFKLNQILSLFSIGIKRSSEELENQIRTIIRTRYTSIHPAVEWKFINSAVNFINKEMKGLPEKEIEPIIFEDVYALYGASDIRSSTQERNKAIREDLTEQLVLLEKALMEIYKIKNLALIEQILYQIAQKKEALSKELLSGDEANIVEFNKYEVEPVMKELARNNENIARIYNSYTAKLDPQLHTIYHKRKDFEESLNKINDLISKYLDNEEKKLQAIFPHYYEKYKTDGVEYNMYIGDSITEDQTFAPIYIQNLRLWQILSMAEIAVKTAHLLPELKVRLETTQLILVQSTPLSIRFRMDEKRFDVDGTYNVRYEIIKKRIDKALIKNTRERLTRPGSVAIVYSQEKEALEYKGYIEFLQFKNILLAGLEELELEDLQDIQGLKALRVNVNLENPEDIMIQNLLSETLTYKN